MQTLLKQSIIGGLSFLLLTGIAFSVGSSEQSQFQVNASTTVTYTISARDTLIVSGTKPTDSTQSLVATYTVNAFQMTASNSQTVTLGGWNGYKITSITLSMRSNSSAGAGGFTYSTDGGTTTQNIVPSATNFNNVAWYGAWSTTYVNVTKVVDIVATSSDLVFKISTTTNSLYCESYSFVYEAVAQSVTGVSLTPENATIVGVGSTKQLNALISPLNATNKDVEWTSSNESIATVNSSGLVTAVSLGGPVTITVTTDDGAFTDTSTIYVRTISDITIKTNSSKTTFAFSETISSPSLVLTLTYNDDETEDVSSGYSLSGYNSKQLGTQTITITYPGFTGTNPTYAIFLSNLNSASINASDLFISEYIEGSSNNKSIEIYNGTGASIDLTQYSVQLFSNGSPTATATLNLTGTLLNNDVYVISNASSIQAIKDVSNITSFTSGTDVTFFNGDDAIGLYKGATLIDVFGVIGTDPGASWSVGSGSTVDNTLVRKSTVKTGVTTWNTSEWDVYPIDTISNLGTHSFPENFSSLEQAQAYADYLEQFTTCSLTGPDSISTLVAEYNAMLPSSKTEFASITIDDYDNDAYLANGSSYSGLTRTSTVNALAKLNRIISLYNTQNPSNTVVLNARVPNRTITEDNHVVLILVISISTLFGMLWFLKRRNYLN